MFNFLSMGIGDWGLGIGDWGLGIGPNPQSPNPNPQLNHNILKYFYIYNFYFIYNIILQNKIKVIIVIILNNYGCLMN